MCFICDSSHPTSISSKILFVDQVPYKIHLPPQLFPSSYRPSGLAPATLLPPKIIYQREPPGPYCSFTTRNGTVTVFKSRATVLKYLLVETSHFS